MSRSNPFKKKRRVANRTLLIYGEGLDDETFLKYLRWLYSFGRNVQVTVRSGTGGSAVNVVIQAFREPGDFDRKIVVLDNDKESQEMIQARQEAQRRSIELLENTPCIEAMLLAVLKNDASSGSKSSKWCKTEFESKHIDEKKRTELAAYLKVFPKTLLDSRRSKVKELNRLISLMLGEF